MAGRKPNGRERPSDHDVLTTLALNQGAMQNDIKWIRTKIDYLYSVDPPGPLMKLTTHLSEHDAAKWRERTVFTMIAGASGTIASYIYHLFSH